MNTIRRISGDTAMNIVGSSTSDQHVIKRIDQDGQQGSVHQDGGDNAINIVSVAGSEPQHIKQISQGGGGTPGTDNYERLYNKPSIESVTLIGDKTFEELGLESISNIELHNLLH